MSVMRKEKDFVVEIFKFGNPKTSVEMMERIKRERAKGKTYRSISNSLGVCTCVISRVLRGETGVEQQK